MRIQIFSDDPFAATPLEKRLSEQGLDFCGYQPGEAIEATHFVLISPIWCNGKFVVCDRVWKKYFEEYKDNQSRPYRKIRLITAGYDRAKHENYLCLLDIPEDLPAFFDATSPCYEDWQPFAVKGLDATDILRKFYLGHGKDSVLAAFDSIAIKVYDIEKYRHTMPFQKIVDTETGLISPENLITLWLNFRIRWGHYFAFADCLPFYLLLLELEEISNKIHVFFHTGCTNVNLFAENNVAAHIRRIKDILEECSTYAS